MVTTWDTKTDQNRGTVGQEGIQLSRVDQLALVVVIDAVIWGSFRTPKKTAGWGPQLAQQRHTRKTSNWPKERLKHQTTGYLATRNGDFTTRMHKNVMVTAVVLMAKIGSRCLKVGPFDQYL